MSLNMIDFPIPKWDRVRTSFGLDYSDYDSDGNLEQVPPAVVLGSDEDRNYA